MITYLHPGALHHSEMLLAHLESDVMVRQGTGFRSQKETTTW